MWQQYSSARSDSDFAAISSMGANAVRIIVQPSSFGYPIVNPVYQLRLNDIIERAAAHGLAVQLSLFDWFSDFGDLSGSKVWAHQILAPLKTNTTVALLELRNEVNLQAPGAASWTREMLTFLHREAPDIPLTTSIAAQNASSFATLDRLGGSNLSVIDVHLYGPMTSMTVALNAARAVAKGRNVFVGETGLSTFGPASQCREQAQTIFYQSVIGLAGTYSVIALAPWTLNDFSDAGVPRNSRGTEQHFGLRTVAGRWKPAAGEIRQLFARGLRVSAAGIRYGKLEGGGNTFSCGLQTSAKYSGPGWSVFAGTYARQAGIAPRGGPNSTPAAFLSGTTGTPSLWPAVTRDFPVLSHARVTVSVKARLVGATGTTDAAIAWFHGSAYLGSTSSRAAAVQVAGWQPLSVSAAPPPGADSFQVHLKSAYNSGTAYFADFSIN